MIRAEDRIQLHIAKKIIHPAHVPLIVKTKSVFLYRRCDLRPCSRLLCDQQRTVFILFENRIQMFKKLYCLQILIAAVNICNPLAVIFSVVQIQHRSHCIHPDSICMVYVFPEQCIRNQKIRYLRTTIIVNQRTPVRMGTFTRIKMLIQTRAVKCTQSKSIAREMRRYPVKDYADPLLMHIVHEIHKILRRTVARGRCIIPGHLIAPGCIKRVLHHRHQLHMRIAHFFYVVCQHWSKLAVIVKLPSVVRFSPGTKMYLINSHRLLILVFLFPLLHPFFIRPLKL